MKTEITNKKAEKQAAVTSSASRDERWISVKNKLPNDGDAVIFGANNISDMQDRLCKPMVMAGWFMGGKFYSYLTKEVLKPNFWMLMPVLNNGTQLDDQEKNEKQVVVSSNNEKFVINFLRSKGMLKGKFTRFSIGGQFGDDEKLVKVSLNELLIEYANLVNKKNKIFMG